MDETRFIKAYDDFADALFRHCYFRLYDREEAKDAVQEAFLKAWNYGQKNNVKNIRALLYKIAGNVVIDRFRKKQAVSLDEMHENGFEPKDDNHEKIMLNAEAKNFIKMLHHLDDLEREVIIMRYIDELGPEEIADIVTEKSGEEVTPNLISVRLNRAVGKLQKLINQ